MRPHLFAAAILALPALQSPRATTTVDVPAYLVELERVTAAIASAQTPEDARAVATAFPDRWWVTAEGQVVVVDMQWVDDRVSTAAGDPPRWRSVQDSIGQRLTTMRAIAAAPIESGSAAPDRALAAVLARPEFNRSPTSRWLEEQRARFANWLSRIFDRMAGSGISSRTIAITVAWTLSTIALVALTLWIVRVLTRRSRAAALELGAAAPARAPAREWAMRALAAARAGDLREAVRCAYHAAVSRLDEQGAWTADETRTPREYLRLLRHDDPRHPTLLALTRQFEQVWYGRRTPTLDDAQTLAAHLERLGCLHASERAI